MTVDLIEERNLDTERMPCADRDRVYSDASTSQDLCQGSSEPPEGRREAWDRFSLRASSRDQLCQQPVFGILSSRL